VSTLSAVAVQTRYAVRLRHLASSARLVDPGVKPYVALHDQARALEAAVRAEAPEMAGHLIGECRRTLAGIRATSTGDPFEAAVVADGRAALNRLANMIRCNDPDPLDPPAT